MINAVLQGALLGFLLSILVGPFFFLMLQTSIREGFKAAMILDAGAILSDICCIVACYWGVANILNDPWIEKMIVLVGGSILTGFGIYTFFKHNNKTIDIAVKDPSHTVLFIKGFFINITNPSVILFWLGTVGMALTQFKGNTPAFVTYFTACLVTFSVIDVAKAYMANKIRKRLTSKALVFINKIAGSVITAFGLSLIVRFFIK